LVQLFSEKSTGALQSRWIFCLAAPDDFLLDRRFRLSSLRVHALLPKKDPEPKESNEGYAADEKVDGREVGIS
jgi:hypothetical protein